MLDYNGMTRKQLLRERARYPLAQTRLGEVDAQLAELNRELDLAVEQYTAECEPLQVEMRQIEDKLLASIMSREPLDQATEERRKQVVQEIERAALQLETTRDEISRRQRVVNIERDKLLAEMPAVDVINAQLFRGGDGALQTRHQALAEAARLVNNSVIFPYVKRIEAHRIDIKDRELSPDDPQVRSLQRAEITLAALNSAVAAMQGEASEIYNQLIEV